MVIVDTSCLITLDRIGRLDILQRVFGEIAVTEEIRKEFGQPLLNWVKIVPARNESYLKLLLNSLDAGEASAIALAQEQRRIFSNGRTKWKTNGRKITTQLYRDFRGAPSSEESGVHYLSEINH